MNALEPSRKQSLSGGAVCQPQQTQGGHFRRPLTWKPMFFGPLCGTFLLLAASHRLTAAEPKKLQEILNTAPRWEDFIARDGRVYRPDEDVPYTGWVVMRHGNEGLALCHCKHGLFHGTSTSWYQSGQKRSEHTYHKGKLSGLSTKWFENGQKMDQGNYRDGKLHGLWIFWDQRGNEIQRETYKDGLRIDR
jgi:hypothetical protein